MIVVAPIRICSIFVRSISKSMIKLSHVFLVLALFIASFAQAQPINNVTPAPYEVVHKDGVYRFEGEPKVKYVTVADGRMPAESYRLKVAKKGVTITSSDAAGAFYARQTLDQLIDGDTLPYCEIYDYPRFPYRGLHVDVSRHFRSVDFLKKQMDAMAMFKMNRMHIHLTDAAGWRMQIDAYPRLTEFAFGSS